MEGPKSNYRDVCGLCGLGRIERATHTGQVTSNIRKWKNHVSTVWECPECGSFNSLEKLDMSLFYKDYPLHDRRLNWATRRILSPYLRKLRGHGLQRYHSILDYGCGNGVLVSFLRERGYSKVRGFDPYTPGFSDVTGLTQGWDWILCQDVLEHVEDPCELIDKLVQFVVPGGFIFIGTPRAESLNLKDPEPYTHSFHQPFHLHIFSEKGLIQKATQAGLHLKSVHRVWSVDTWIPFLNWRFLQGYMKAVDNSLDTALEPVKMRVILTSPKLWFLGLFGGFVCNLVNRVFGQSSESTTEIILLFQKPTNSKKQDERPS